MDITRIVAAIVAGMLIAPALAQADADVSGTVVGTNPAGAPVANAFVAVTGPGGRYGARTDVDGAFTVPGVVAGTYTIVAQAPGHRVARAEDVVVDATPVVQDLEVESSGTVFESLGVFGGQVSGIVADAQSGVFYASTSVIPQVYRSADHGGTWTPVTLAADDPDDGLDGSNVGGGLTTSGVAGEVAVEVQGTVHFSTDFGVTWRSIANAGGPGGGGPASQLLWGHAGATNVLVRVRDGGTERADMSDASPAFVAQATGYKASPDDRVALAHGTDAAWVAVVRQSGTLEIFDLAENPPATVVSTLAGLPAPPTLVRLGGARGAGVPPDAVLVYANGGGNQAVVATKSGGTTWTSVSAATAVSGCGEGPGSVGAVAPQSTGTTAAATLSQCFVEKSGTGALVLSSIPGINNNTGLAFDAGYDRATNFVVLSGDGNRGLVKSASEQTGKPFFPQGVDAAPGTDPLSGGVAVNGFDVPVVKDTAFGPTASHFATALSGSGGGLSVASDDGGATIKTVVPKGGSAVDWWSGSAGTWLVFGHGGAGDLVTAYGDWDGTAAALPGPNVGGSSAAVVGPAGMPEQFAITAIRGVPGADVVFVGGGRNVDQSGDAGSVYRASLGGAGAAVSFADGTMLAGTDVGGSLVTTAVRALAYCPVTGSDASVQDVLFVATGNDADGRLVRITGATGASPAETSVLDGTRVNDVRAHCGSGTVWAGLGSNMGGPSGSLQRSTDGGVTFAPVPLAGPGAPPSLNVQVVAIDAADAGYVLVAGNSEGFILQSTDGGTSWTLVNDPHAPGGRNFLSEGVGDLEVPPAGAPLGAGVARLVGGGAALVGTGGGLYAASFSGLPGGGGGGGSCTTDADCDDADACTVDACGAGTCSHVEEPSAASVRCELDALTALLACADAKTAKVVGKKLGRVRTLLGKVEASTKVKKTAKLVRAIAKQLGKLDRKIGKAKATDASCKEALAAQLDALGALVGAL